MVIEDEGDGVCDFCKSTAELRPYGPNRERICFECAMKDEQTTRRIFNRDILGEEETH